MDYKLTYQRKLPHFQPKDGIFCITTRLAFDIPTVYMNAMTRYREGLRRSYEKAEDTKLAEEIIKKKCFAYEDELYTKCATSVDLTLAPAQGVITSKLLEMSNEYYYLYAFTIMPNHPAGVKAAVCFQNRIKIQSSRYRNTSNLPSS